MDEIHFRSEVRQLLTTIKSGGIDKLHEEGFRLRSLDDMNGLPRRGIKVFIRGCHYSFNIAQNHIARLVVNIIGERNTADNSLREAAVQADQSRASRIELQISALDRQQLLLRRLMDCILLHFVGSEVWMLRRLMLHHKIKSIDPKVLSRTVAEANRRNRENRMTFHLVTDLLSGVHVGDLIKVDRTDITKPLQPGEWEIIELKEGEVNDKLGSILQRIENRPPSPIELQEVQDQMGAKAVKQIERMVRQRTRQVRLQQLIRTDEGPDPLSGLPMHLIDSDRDYSDYFHLVRKICEVLAEQPVVSGIYQKCLYLTGETRQHFERGGYTSTVHRIHHMKNQEEGCGFGQGPEAAKREFLMMSELAVADLIDVNLLRSGWSISLFDWPLPKEDVFRLAFGEYRIFIWIDFGELFRRAAEAKGISIEWIPKDMKGLKGISRDFVAKYSSVIPGSPNSRGAWVSRAGEPKQIFMSGFFNRIIVELMSPEYLIGLLENSLDRAAMAHRQSNHPNEHESGTSTGTRVQSKQLTPIHSGPPRLSTSQPAPK